jgi:hypothetical protein
VRVSEVGPVTWPAYESTSVGVRSTGDKFIVDLGQLDLRTERARSELARAVALADLAAPKTSDEDSSGARPESTTAQPEPRSTAAPAAGEHSEQEPLVTARDAAGEHSSAVQSRRDRLAVLSRIRATVKNMETKG